MNNSTATYTSTVVPNLCVEVVPPRATIKPGTNVCVEGSIVPPVIVPGHTTGIEYVVVQQPNAKNRWTYVVTATIVADGIAWGDLSGTGWTAESPTVATFTSTVVVKNCYLPKPPVHVHPGHPGKGTVTVDTLPSTGAGPSTDSMFGVAAIFAMLAMLAAASGVVLRRKQI
ncbi:MAG: hypothetical protein QM692_01345 [Thermomicrobiales bacterium]